MSREPSGASGEELDHQRVTLGRVMLNRERQTLRSMSVESALRARGRISRYINRLFADQPIPVVCGTRYPTKRHQWPVVA